MNWKKKGSRIPGYEYSYLTVDKGNVFRVDYSLDKKNVRLLLETTGGKRYYTEISNGKVYRSNVLTPAQKNSNELDILTQNREIFQSLPDYRIIKLIRNHHNIKLPSESFAEDFKKEQEQKEIPLYQRQIDSYAFHKDTDNLDFVYTRRPHLLIRLLRRLGILRGRKSPPHEPTVEVEIPSRERDWGFWKRLFWETLEFSVIIALAYSAHYYFGYQPLYIAIALGLIGALNGFWVIFIRDREPYNPKIAALLSMSIGVYLYYYF